MIDTEQAIVIDAAIGKVWEFASDIRAWAGLMPGLRECDVPDGDHSVWTLKVGVGALVRTVKVSVTVDRWAGPEEVDFTYSLEGDPVQGGGTYRARALGPMETEVLLAVKVIGTGPMAPMWEAMGRPLLPKFAHGFAEQFKAEVEQVIDATPSVPEASHSMPPRRQTLAGLVGWLRKLFSRIADSKSRGR